MLNKCQNFLSSVLIVVILAALVDNRSYNNGLIFYDPQANNVFLPPTVSVSRGRGLANVQYSSKGSIWSTFGKPCDCSGVVCGCCAGIRVKQFSFDQKMCANVTFLAEKHEAILDVYLNKAPSSRFGISARNPSPICIPVMLPIPMAMCVQMSDIAIKGNNLHMCMDFVVRLATTDFFEMHFQCMQMGLDGVQYLDKDGKPVFPMGSKSQIVFNQKQSEEEDNEYYDENLPNENEIDSNDSKVEQNDYEEKTEPNEEIRDDEIKVLNSITAHAIDNEEENADEAVEEAEKDVDKELAKDTEDSNDAQSAIIAESVTNMQNLTTYEKSHEKLDGNATTMAAILQHDMHNLENLVNVATTSPMASTTTTSTTISTTTATNTAGNNVENVDAFTDKVNDADAYEDYVIDENEGEEHSEDEDDDDDDDESEDEDSDEDDEDTDDKHDVGDDVNNNDENDSDAIATKIITEFSASNTQPHSEAERISVAAAAVPNQATDITLPTFVVASEISSPGIEETSRKRHFKLLNYRRARG